ncbi:hypothetical protein [Afipia felis]|uniref:Uncharacterized protein n=2 Tax=Afipia felis TaxID=1035 RepID=A0A380WBV2_AFIFE|nr:hypothetical protein [Afipia felis]EKS29698.1 hypothetical protein HMPREF9697_02226 [Afipia felis ATCC 53690]SUU78405.1 Uncharacterised protein [Afipia felis]SUU86470.1 Uncharacterised protein [Afipia felis]
MSDTGQTFLNIADYLQAPAPLPPGYETCWGFLARTEPETLSLMMDPIAGIAPDELRARRIAKAMLVPVMTFPAPACLTAAEGLTMIGAYPAAVLERTFPASP